MRQIHHLAPVVLCAMTPISVDAATQRQPTGKWVIDYAETSCTAKRDFGGPGSPLILAFWPSPTGAVVRLAVARLGKVGNARHFQVRTNVTDAAANITGLRFGARDKKTEVIWINFDRPVMDRIVQAGEIEIDSDEIAERFALPGFNAVVKALDICNSDLRAHWNVAGAGGSVVSTDAVPIKNLAAYVSDADYPQQAVYEGLGGRTRFVLMIDETGSVKDCMVEESSGIATLDAMSCIVLVTRAEFKPALDENKRPVRSVLTSRIRWVMP